jgi:hypothetical protein
MSKVRPTTPAHSPKLTSASIWTVLLAIFAGGCFVLAAQRAPSSHPVIGADHAAPIQQTSLPSTLSTGGESAQRAVESGEPSSSSNDRASSPRALPIKDLRLMQRVVGQNPQVTDEQRAAFEPIDPAQWRALTLEMTKEDGGRLEIELARPLSWIEFNEAVEGGWVYLDLEELGAVGEARVVGIAPCPPLEGDPASPAGLITGLFRHESGEVVDVHIAGLDEPIGTTANHPFWSEDQQTFVPASALGVGEQVRTLAGLAHVTSVTARGPPESVYNLEVHGEHVYQVTSLGVLVHNSYATNITRWKGPAPKWMTNPHPHHVAVKGSFSHYGPVSAGYARYAREVLERNKIGLDSADNLFWAPNRGHSKAYLRQVAHDLRAAEKVGGRAAVVARLEEIAALFVDGRYP